MITFEDYQPPKFQARLTKLLANSASLVEFKRKYKRVKPQSAYEQRVYSEFMEKAILKFDPGLPTGN